MPIGWGASHQPMRGTVLRRWDRILQPSVGIRHVWLDFPVAVKHALRVHMYSPSQKRAGTTFSSFGRGSCHTLRSATSTCGPARAEKRKLVVQQLTSAFAGPRELMATYPRITSQVDLIFMYLFLNGPHQVRPPLPTTEYVRQLVMATALSTGLLLRFFADLLVMF